MTYSNIALTEPSESFLVKNLIDKTYVLVIAEHAVVVYNDTAALLTSVLLCIKRYISLSRNIACLVSINAETAAFFMDTCYQLDHSLPFQQ